MPVTQPLSDNPPNRFCAHKDGLGLILSWTSNCTSVLGSTESTCITASSIRGHGWIRPHIHQVHFQGVFHHAASSSPASVTDIWHVGYRVMKCDFGVQNNQVHVHYTKKCGQYPKHASASANDKVNVLINHSPVASLKTEPGDLKISSGNWKCVDGRYYDDNTLR